MARSSRDRPAGSAGPYASADDFKADARREFRFLVRDYGYSEHVPPANSPLNPFRLMFHNATTIVVIEGVGYGFGVSVGLGRRERVPYELELYSLLNLLQVKKADSPLMYEGGLPDDPAQAVLVREYARALQKWGGEILRGDFGLWPAVRKARWRLLKTRPNPQRS